MEYMTIQEASKKWSITERRIQVLCSEGRLDGAVKFGRQWAIPADLEKPDDARIKTGKYIKWRSGVSSFSPKIFSFFSGSGFLDLGFEESGFEVVKVNEYYKPFLEAYEYSREKMGIAEPTFGYYHGDINDFLNDKAAELAAEIKTARKDGSLVGFIGGPPCPDFSVAGKNRGREGDNGKLSQSYIDLIVRQQPDFFLFENVKGLIKTARHRAFFEELKKLLHQAGYVTTDRLTNSLEFGAAQDRDRILMFGVKSDLLSKPERIEAFPWDVFRKYNADEVKALAAWPDTDTFAEDGELDNPEGVPLELTIQHWFEKNDVENHPNAREYFQPKAGLVRMQTVLEGDVSKKCYKRPHRWRFSPTAAYGNNEVHLHPYKARRMSVAETLAIQSLPAEFQLPPDMTLTDKFKTIGNGVPYMLSQGIAKTVYRFLTTEVHVVGQSIKDRDMIIAMTTSDNKYVEAVLECRKAFPKETDSEAPGRILGCIKYDDVFEPIVVCKNGGRTMLSGDTESQIENSYAFVLNEMREKGYEVEFVKVSNIAYDILSESVARLVAYIEKIVKDSIKASGKGNMAKETSKIIDEILDRSILGDAIR